MTVKERREVEAGAKARAIRRPAAAERPMPSAQGQRTTETEAKRVSITAEFPTEPKLAS